MLSDGLDSIAQQENMLFYTNKGKEGTIVDRKQLKKNIEMFAETIKNQRIRISELMETIKKRGANINKLNKLVNYLNQQSPTQEKKYLQLSNPTFRWKQKMVIWKMRRELDSTV